MRTADRRKVEFNCRELIKDCGYLGVYHRTRVSSVVDGRGAKRTRVWYNLQHRRNLCTYDAIIITILLSDNSIIEIYKGSVEPTISDLANRLKF